MSTWQSRTPVDKGLCIRIAKLEVRLASYRRLLSDWPGLIASLENELEQLKAQQLSQNMELING